MLPCSRRQFHSQAKETQGKSFIESSRWAISNRSSMSWNCTLRMQNATRAAHFEICLRALKKPRFASISIKSCLADVKLEQLKRGRGPTFGPWQFGNATFGDQVSWAQLVFTVRSVPRHQIEVVQLNQMFLRSVVDADGTIQSDQSHREVTGMGGNTRGTDPKDRVHPVFTVDCGTTAPRFTLVARRVDVAEITAPCSLQEVSADADHIRDLTRNAFQKRLGNDRIMRNDSG
jgi:hypothetical protein